MKISNRTRGFGTTIFTEMSMLARQHNAVNLGQGFPDFDGPDWVKSAAIDAIHGTKNQYAVSSGDPDLRVAIADYYESHYQLMFNPQVQVLVTSGATEALLCALFAVVDPGASVIVIEPAYDSYRPAIEWAGGTVISVAVDHPEFRLDTQAIRNAVRADTVAIIINTPHNPTGAVLSNAELQEVADICVEHDLIAICDEVYDQIVFDGTAHTPLATLAGMADRCITIGSLGKTFSLTGWKIGWATGSEELVAAMAALHQFMVFSTASPLQVAAAAALRAPASYYADLRAMYHQKRELLYTALAEIGFEPALPKGSYFIVGSIEKFTDNSASDFCRTMVEQIGVAAIPLAPFCSDKERVRNLVRFCFCKTEAVLTEATTRLKKLRQ